VKTGGMSRSQARLAPRFTAAAADLPANPALRSARVLDVLSSTPARPASRAPCLGRHVHALAARLGAAALPVLLALLAVPSPAGAADKALLDILLGNGVITQRQYDSLIDREELRAEDLGIGRSGREAAPAGEEEARIEDAVDQVVISGDAGDSPVRADWGSKGFTLSTRDGNWTTALQWRAQTRYTYPLRSDPRQISAFTGEDESTFELRRVRMKIGGHAYRPWLGYYFELDLQPTRSTGDDSASASSRLIDYRITLDRFDQAAIRLGQWKIDYNRERVDSSGRQQFVERSIVNRVFTIDRQMGVQLRGRLFADTGADMRYWAGVFTGEGRGVANDDGDMMYMGRLQWNFLGRDLPWRQTDVEYTERPTGSIAFAAATTEGRCTRWSSSGCGNLDGFAAPANARDGQFAVDQMVQELAFKWRGLSVQQEFHWKSVTDRVNGSDNDLTGAYAQAGYFLHHLLPAVPAPLELAFRYAFVDEPNALDRAQHNFREEFTIGANWFFAGHRNKLSLDVSHLALEDPVLGRDVDEQRLRFQWDVSL